MSQNLSQFRKELPLNSVKHKTMKTRDKNNNTENKYKRTHAWTHLNKIETDCSWVFGKLVSLMVFQSSFSLLNSYI